MSRNDLKLVDGKVLVGCEPRSKTARIFNALVLLTGLLSGLAGLLMLSGILGDIPFRPPFAERPEDDARLKLARADELAAAGKLAESARLDQAVALGLGAPETVDAAVQPVKTLLARSAVENNAAEQASRWTSSHRPGARSAETRSRTADGSQPPAQAGWQRGRGARLV